MKPSEFLQKLIIDNDKIDEKFDDFFIKLSEIDNNFIDKEKFKKNMIIFINSQIDAIRIENRKKFKLNIDIKSTTIDKLEFIKNELLNIMEE